MKSYYIENLSESRKKLLANSAAKPFIEKIMSDADAAVEKEELAFKMSDYVLYYKTGNRSVFENHYFTRRNNCNKIMLAYWLTEDDKYLLPLIDYISYICDEFSWCLPAHAELPDRLSKGTIEHVDLFQAETARLFAEIVMCVGEKLPEYILDRMNYEIHRRIFTVFESTRMVSCIKPDLVVGDKYSWETCKMNWATVCGAGCTMAALYFGTEEEKEKYVKRFTGCLDSYLEGIEDDGCCQEGMSYWNYGFSHFVILAQAVRIYTDGKIDYFKNPKVKELALFPQKIRLSDSKVTSFSDGGEAFSFKIGLMSFLKAEYDEVLLPNLQFGSLRGNVDSFFDFIWFAENYKGDPLTPCTSFFNCTEWYVNRKKKYSFAAKGGYNDEPHNHNDIGSFMITVGDDTFISDLGCGEYVRETFMAETRYTFIQNSSRGHSVPIINGTYQIEGKEYRAQNTSASENTFSLDIEGAYKKGLIDKIHREFELFDDKVVMRDFFLPNEKTESITERIISKVPPRLNGEFVEFDFGKIKFNPARCSVAFSSETFVAHNAVDIITAYKTDFILNDLKENEFELEFII